MKNPRQTRGSRYMTHAGRSIGGFAFFMFTAVGVQQGSAQLRSLDKAPWFGFFAGYTNRNFRIGLSSKGDIRLIVLGSGGEPVMDKLAIPIVPSIEETLPDGRVVNHPIIPDSLRSEHDVTDKIGKVVVQGKITGDATFEVTLEQDRGMILIGGRVLDAGNLKNLLGFAWKVDFTAPYPYSRANFDEKAAKAFQKKLKRDHFDLKWPDNKTQVLNFIGEGAQASLVPEAMLSGIAEARIEICSYGGKKFSFLASRNSGITLVPSPRESLPGGLSLLDGFSLVWRPDSAKDSDGNARLAIDVR